MPDTSTYAKPNADSNCQVPGTFGAWLAAQSRGNCKLISHSPTHVGKFYIWKSSRISNKMPLPASVPSYVTATKINFPSSFNNCHAQNDPACRLLHPPRQLSSPQLCPESRVLRLKRWICIGRFGRTPILSRGLR